MCLNRNRLTDKKGKWGGKNTALSLLLLPSVICLLTSALCLLFSASCFAGASVSVSGGDWAIGVKGASVESTSASNNWTITNDNSGGIEDVLIKVESSGSWTASTDATLTNNEFLLRKDNASGQIITAVDETLTTGLTNNATYSFGLYFKTPPIGSEEGAHTLTVTLTATNWVWACGNNFTVDHTAGAVAPVTKTVTYGTVLTSLSGESKCWITQNLGATTNAATATEDTEPNGGWYWQFNLKQGYYQPNANGALISTATPSTWDSSDDNTACDPVVSGTEWCPVNDPCTLLLGAGWRIPTYTEWLNVDATGAWVDYNGTYASVLKLHAAGSLDYSNGTLYSRGSSGSYWSSTQDSATFGWYLGFDNSFSSMDYSYKAYGVSVRCLKD